MNRKTLLISLALILAAFVALWFLFFRQAPPQAPGATPPAEANPFPVSTTTVVSPPPATSDQVPPAAASAGTTTVAMALDKTCIAAGNVFEKNDCISSLAKTRNDKALCAYVVGSLAQDQCLRGGIASQAVTPFEQSANPTYEAFVNSYFSAQVSGKSANVAPSAASAVLLPKASAPVTDASVRYDLSFGARLAVYSASRYQVAPGAPIKIYGAGFTQAGNVLNIGSQQTTVGSSDGSTLDAVAPSGAGEYEIWVTNAKGSSKLSSRAVKILVTDSPAPLPEIVSASPSPVSVDGTVTLTGTGFGASNNVLTSMGILQNVPSDGTTISFAISSLPFSSYSKNTPQLKGKIIPILVNVQTAGGSAEKLFQLDVQF